MTESEVVNEWISQGEVKGQLKERRQKLLRLLQRKFPGLVPEEVSHLVGRQESLPVLDDWFDAAISAATIQDFLAALRR